MPEILDLLFTRRLWRYDPAAHWSENLTHWFNLAEAGCWFVFAALVWLRWRRCRKSAWEWVYAALFVTFGLTDLREASALHSWLLWIKAANLAGLLWLRWWLIRTHYPTSRTY